MSPEHAALQPPEILYREGPCIVVAKPGGVLTQAPPHIDSMERRIKSYLKDAEDKTGNVYLGMPHRLDRPASGALVVARHVRAARRLCEQFETRQVLKLYWALVEGSIPETEGQWHDWVRKIPDVAQAQVVEESHAEAKFASLRFRVIQRREGRTLLEIELETGRTHQIRLQAAHRGHPIVGDSLYGATLPFGPRTDEPRDRWIALHARRLAFRHPMTREPVDVTAPMPAWWRAEDLPEDAEA
ncbi:MAG: RluA family pseudouridine synthase [Planctomycetales bacterium]|nr:RluA family pseudouridine synthase [Planctomycetales bacterium]